MRWPTRRGAIGFVATIPLLLAGCSAGRHAAPTHHTSVSAVPVASRTAAASSAAGRPPGRAAAALPVQPGFYLGVYEPRAPGGSYSLISEFAAAVGSQPRIVLRYSAWGEPFQGHFARTALAHGATLLVQIEPRSVSLAGLAAGRYDPYIRSYAHQVAIFRHPVIIGFGHEMNGNWYPWGWRHVRPPTFTMAWRHMVTVFRRNGASNVTWLWTVSHGWRGSPPAGYWWPGERYVDWVGIDGYYEYPGDRFAKVFGQALAAVRRFTRDPVLISETAAGPGIGDQAAGISNLFAGIVRWKLLGLVWFDKRQVGGVHHQDWRLEGNPAALAAFRRGLALMRPRR